MRYFSVVFLCLMACCLTACAQKAQQRQRDNERATADLQNGVVDLNQRLAAMEQHMTMVNNEISVLKNQPYPVKTTKGAKTNFVASAPGTSAPPPLTPAVYDPRVANASAPSPGAPAAVPPSQRQGDGWLSSYAAPPPSPARGSGSKAVPASVVQGPRTLIPQEQPQAVPALQPKRQAGANELALPPETSAAAQQQAAAPVSAPGAPKAAPLPAPRGAKQEPSSALQNFPGQGSEEVMYNKALSEFNANRYSQAAAGFTELMYTYPTGRYAPNAGYWLGESLYGQNQYGDALMQFKEVTSRFPRHQKAPDALFKAGLCYMRLGDKENAALQFNALAADYPSSPAANLARQRGFVR